MAVVHLQFDIDSEVHPELHDMLASISSTSSREERFRQLAATGLVWERLRVRAHAADPNSALAQPQDGAHAAAGVAQAVETKPARADLTHEVDLADHLDPAPETAAGITAAAAAAAAADTAVEVTAAIAPMPAPAAIDPIAPELFLREMRRAVRELPVLTDVVDSAELFSIDAAAANEAAHHEKGAAASRAGAEFLSLKPATRTPAKASRDVREVREVRDVRDVREVHEAVYQHEAARADAADGNGAGANDPTPELPPARKTATRSRLMRMKEKGLFKNE